MVKRNGLAICLCVALLLLNGCGTTDKAAQNLQEVTVGEVAHSIFYAPQYVAMELGYFEEEGLEIDLLNLQGADKVMSALISDEIQIALMGPEASIYVSNQKLENYAINFAQLTQRDGSFLVGREANETFSFDQLTQAEILGGRKGGVPEMTLEYVLKTNGVDIGVDDTSKPVNVRTDIQFAAMAGVFLSGESDYVTLFEPTATQFEREGKGHIVASIGEYSGNIPYTAYSAAKSYLENEPETIQKFTNAIYKGQQFVAQNEAADIAPLLQPYFADISLEDLILVVQRYKNIEAWDTNPVLEPEALEKLMDVMVLAGQLEQRADYHAIVTTKFAETAIATATMSSF